MRRKHVGIFAGMFFFSALLLGACGQSEGDGALPLDEAHFPDEAFRAYLAVYVDENGDGILSRKERDAVLGFGSVECQGGLADGTYEKKDNMTRGEQLRAIQSMEGIEYFTNLQEIYFKGGYKLQKLLLDNPKLTSVWVEISSLEEFSIRNASELCSFHYAVCASENIAWNEMTKLERLELIGAELAFDELEHCKSLTCLSLEGCRLLTQEDAKGLDFSAFSGLSEFYCSMPGRRDVELAEELHFENNEKLAKVVLDAKAARKLILPGIDVDCFVEGAAETCEVLFADEMRLDTTEALPEGSVWLTAENFPDVVFRQYLYRYADQDRDHILTAQERGLLTELGEMEDMTLSEEEKQQREEMLKRVYSFEGIYYLENLRRIYLDGEYKVKELYIDNPGLEELLLSGTDIDKFSIKNPDSLKRLIIFNESELELDLDEMKSLEAVNIRNVTADFAKLLQNENLQSIILQDCTNREPQEEMDFSILRHLGSILIYTKNPQEEYWTERLYFGSKGRESRGSVRLSGNVAKKAIISGKGVYCAAGQGCEVIYLDDYEDDAANPLPAESVYNGPENIPNPRLRCYIYEEVDTDKDNILTLEERAALTYFVDSGYNYDKDKDDEDNVFKWKVEDDFSPYVYGINDLRGFEYFPNLVRLQLEHMKLSEDITEIVITNPKLEILDLQFNGNVETIDLTACKNLRVCVIDSTRDDDFVQEVKPTILLPEHLKWQTVEGMDCVIGEGAMSRYGKGRK